MDYHDGLHSKFREIRGIIVGSFRDHDEISLDSFPAEVVKIFRSLGDHMVVLMPIYSLVS